MRLLTVYAQSIALLHGSTVLVVRATTIRNVFCSEMLFPKRAPMTSYVDSIAL